MSWNQDSNDWQYGVVNETYFLDNQGRSESFHLGKGERILKIIGKRIATSGNYNLQSPRDPGDHAVGSPWDNVNDGSGAAIVIPLIANGQNAVAETPMELPVLFGWHRFFRASADGDAIRIQVIRRYTKVNRDLEDSA